MLLLGFGEYTTFAFSVVSAILPLFLTTFVLLYKRDPRKDELKKRRELEDVQRLKKAHPFFT